MEEVKLKKVQPKDLIADRHYLVFFKESGFRITLAKKMSTNHGNRITLCKLDIHGMNEMIFDVNSPYAHILAELKASDSDILTTTVKPDGIFELPENIYKK